MFIIVFFSTFWSDDSPYDWKSYLSVMRMSSKS